MTATPVKPDSSETDLPDAVPSSARLWGTAHITLAVLLAAGCAGFAAKVPGQTYDVQPITVSPTGWCLWGFGLSYLLSIAAVQLRWGRALRQQTFISGREWFLVVNVNGVLAISAAYSILRGHASHTHAFGLETHTSILFSAAALSTMLLAPAGVYGRAKSAPRTKMPKTVLWVLILNMLLAVGTSCLLICLESTPTVYGGYPAETTTNVTNQPYGSRHSREGGNPLAVRHWIPAFAGMTDDPESTSEE